MDDPINTSPRPTAAPSSGSPPTRVIVTFKAGLAFAAANIICVLIAVAAYTHVHKTVNTIDVTVSANRQVNSNLIIWTAAVTAQSPQLAGAYSQLASGTTATLRFLAAHDIPARDIRTSAINISTNFTRDAHGNQTDVVSSYDLTQNVTVTSHAVRHVAAVGRLVTQLIKQGVQVEPSAPQYIYTKLADMKIAMLAAATKDAATRARQIAINSGSHLGKIIYARMGVLQIDPIYSTSVSSEGNDDTTSYRKTIMAVVHAQFQLR